MNLTRLLELTDNLLDKNTFEALPEDSKIWNSVCWNVQDKVELAIKHFQTDLCIILSRDI